MMNIRLVLLGVGGVLVFLGAPLAPYVGIDSWDVFCVGLLLILASVNPIILEE